jgi:hypothetical protein
MMTTSTRYPNFSPLKPYTPTNNTLHLNRGRLLAKCLLSSNPPSPRGSKWN